MQVLTGKLAAHQLVMFLTACLVSILHKDAKRPSLPIKIKI